MQPIRIATIGTSPISDNLLDAARRLDDFAYVGTLSRDAGHATEFTARHGGTTPFSSLEELCACPEVDAVYVASPNALHHGQALACVEAGKHVLVEKPLCPNRHQAEALFAAARLHDVVALEAMRPIHDPAWAAIFAALPRLGRLRRATLRFGRYSSRYDEVLAGRQTNIFDARMATGALMDMGVYTVSPMVALFGAPERVVSAVTLAADARCRETGGAVDGAGSALCTFGAGSGAPGLVAELSWSKVTQDLLPSQIEGELGTITIDAVSKPGRVTLRLRGQAVRADATSTSTSVGDVVEELPLDPCDNTMVFELRDFARLVRRERVQTLWGTALDAAAAEANFRDVTLGELAVTDEIRRQAGVFFPADNRVE